ncbi:MAG: hypothetical protein ACI9XO_004944 [Paraglaciecola sp.]|jgi:hypothetical protein
MERYSQEKETLMIKFYQILDEASKRRYAGIEALKLKHGDKKYIKELLETSYDSISKGISELEGQEELSKDGRIRKKGGGSKGKK